MTRHYYALTSAYGSNVVYNEFNVPAVYCFKSKKDRDNYVYDNWTIDRRIEAVPYREAKKYFSGGKPDFLHLGKLDVNGEMIDCSSQLH